MQMLNRFRFHLACVIMASFNVVADIVTRYYPSFTLARVNRLGTQIPTHRRDHVFKACKSPCYSAVAIAGLGVDASICPGEKKMDGAADGRQQPDQARKKKGNCWWTSGGTEFVGVFALSSLLLGDITFIGSHGHFQRKKVLGLRRHKLRCTAFNKYGV